MKEFLSTFKDPHTLFPLYMIKAMLYSNGYADACILAVIGLFMFGTKTIDKVDAGVKDYFETKRQVISENQFRAGVNADMAKLVEEVNLLKAITSNKGIFGVKK